MDAGIAFPSLPLASFLSLFSRKLKGVSFFPSKVSVLTTCVQHKDYLLFVALDDCDLPFIV